MRNGQQNKRMRGRNRKSHNPLTRVYKSNGPDVKIRGTASHIAEKFLQLARDAQSSGDPIAAENYLQHAEHYFRLIASAQEQFRPNTPFMRGEGGMDMRDDIGDEGEEEPPAGPWGRPSSRPSAPAIPSPICRAMRSSIRRASSRTFPASSRIWAGAAAFRRTTHQPHSPTRRWRRGGRQCRAPAFLHHRRGARRAAPRQATELRPATASKVRGTVFRCTAAVAVTAARAAMLPQRRAGRRPKTLPAGAAAGWRLTPGSERQAAIHCAAACKQPNGDEVDLSRRARAPPGEGASTGFSTGLRVGISFFLRAGMAR